jgi:tRNA 2-thiocytidine biosynthesis protein TtcA
MTKYRVKEMKRLMGKAIYKHNMTEEGDHILVSVSGGKDSMSLLWLLRERIERIPIDYQITAVHVDPGFGFDSANRMRSFFKEHGFRHEIIESDCGPRAHSPENLENPCFLCSRLRRKAVFEIADKLKCNKIAMGHHKDDIIETLFLNLFYGASISPTMPVQNFLNGKLKVIRPLWMADESIIEKYAENMELQMIDLGCPTAGSSKREEIKEMLKGFYGRSKKIKGNIFHAIQNVKPEYLL